MNERSSKRGRILVAARELFARHGPRKCSMEQIAGVARVGKGTLYLYFSSKEELFEAVVALEAEQLLDAVRQAVDAVDHPSDKLRAYLVTRLEVIQSELNLLKVSQEVLLEVVPMLEPLLEQRLRRYFEQEVAMIRDILELGNQRGCFAVSDCQFTALMLFLCAKGLDLPIMLGRFPALGGRDSMGGLADIVLKGLDVR